VNTVDGFQGREKDMIIFSCVRSGEHIGFLSDVRRLNVAITRARSCLVLVGCENTLIRNDCWREMIVYLKSRGASVTCAHFSDVKSMFEREKKEEIKEERQLVTVENPGKGVRCRKQVDRSALMRLIGEAEGTGEEENVHKR
jgi:senataxin